VKISVAIFAHNEERNLERAVRCLLSGRASASEIVQLHILANGCTDRTLDIARKLSSEDNRIITHDIAFGDKSNAWNFYAYFADSDSEVHCFTDGDCWVSEDALFSARDCLRMSSDSCALAGLPLSGRSREELSSYITRYGWIFGGFYAIKGNCLRDLVMDDVRLPIGLVGDDGYVGNFVKSFARKTRNGDRNSVISSPAIGYAFDEIRPLSVFGIRQYVNRQANYLIRQRQFELLEGLSVYELPVNTRLIDSIICERISHGFARYLSPVAYLAQKKISKRLERGYLD
jgi:glycosyltransferase involved in cell wall biosynthesis